MRNANLSHLLTLPVLVVFLSANGWSQDLGTISGVVTDAADAVVAGAKVIVANPQMGITRETTANSSGEYTVAKVPIGKYEITAEAPGFQKLLRTGITLTVGQTLSGKSPNRLRLLRKAWPLRLRAEPFPLSSPGPRFETSI